MAVFTSLRCSTGLELKGSKGGAGWLLGTNGAACGLTEKLLSRIIFSWLKSVFNSFLTLLTSSLSPADIFSSSRILFIAHSSAFAIANSFSSCNRLNSLSFSRNSISACNFADLAAASIKARERCFVEEELNFDLSDDLDFLLKLDFSDGVRLDFLSNAWMRSQTLILHSMNSRSRISNQ